jgi:hypothetical protein
LHKCKSFEELLQTLKKLWKWRGWEITYILQSISSSWFHYNIMPLQVLACQKFAIITLIQKWILIPNYEYRQQANRFKSKTSKTHFLEFETSNVPHTCQSSCFLFLLFHLLHHCAFSISTSHSKQNLLSMLSQKKINHY